MKISRIPLNSALAIVPALSFSLVNTTIHTEEQEEIGGVVKIGGIAWFTAVEDGIKAAGKEQNGAGLV